MFLHFKELDLLQFDQGIKPYRAALAMLKDTGEQLNFSRFSAWLSSFDDRIESEIDPISQQWLLRCTRQSAIPLANWLTSSLCQLRLFRAPRGSDFGLRAAQGLGVDLSTSRVRVGFSRGHLLDICVLIPLDIGGTESELQVAAELYLEATLGDELLDDWVANVAVDRMRRTKGLMMVSDVPAASTSYPLPKVAELVERGIRGLLPELPDSLFDISASHADWTAGADWTALTVEELELGSEIPQPDRCYVSTRFPEALKCCLEGLPFNSARFTRGGEILIWFSWQTPTGVERMALRQRVEVQLGELGLQEIGLPRAGNDYLLAGTGFGIERDYVDLWVRPSTDVIRALASTIAQLTGEVTLGFYDSQLRDESGSFRS